MLSLQSNHIYIRKAITMNEKKLRKSPVVIALYVVAALVLIYSVYLVGSTVSYISSYYGQYGATPGFGETVGYVMQSVYQPLVMSILLGAAGYILNEVRALNPAYYATKEEIEAAKAAKKAAKAKTAENPEEEGAKLEINVEETEGDATVAFESVEGTAGDEKEEALKEAEEQL